MLLQPAAAAQPGGDAERPAFSIAVPERSDDTVQLLRLSFRDFLIDKHRCRDDDFRIPETVAHKVLFRRSVKIMSNILRHDICCLESPSTSISDVEKSRISQHIPTFAAENRTEPEYLVQDARRSALLFCPKVSIVRSLLRSQIPKLLLQIPTVVLQWDPLLQTLKPPGSANLVLSPDGKLVESSNGQIWETSIFSPDGACLVSASEDETVYFWNTTTGDLRRTLRGHQGGQLVASASSEDSSIELWHSASGVLLATILSSTGTQYLAFSPNSRLLALTSTDQDLCLWETATRALLRRIDGDFSAPLFSRGGDLLTFMRQHPHLRQEFNCGTLPSRRTNPHAILTRTRNDAAMIWDVNTVGLLSTIGGRDDQFLNVVSSHDDSLMASSRQGAPILRFYTREQTVEFWDLHLLE
ncbi:WD-repeat protein, putative [Talaromyces stipitatus ATCC 10500]|uniref:WD-repeat protein, putative n=1 Tax=Talaromyces stipitatus (strain ATCC 10500 / CBS 375.48 / QM 6759 / NRRL 1006) TaxID=441959 RepID=B8M6N0_TALSN|nr:WD-repeat protein, putative [Talaromyces stipitatus ATCC 10500]EED19492.1 WD-repeat protein, putative [Talaromyces stipitatus ATCC 10500]